MSQGGVLIVISAVVGIASVVCAILTIIWNRRKMRQTLDHLDGMLTAAIEDKFEEMAFDESLLSAVETKFARYLSGAAVSTKKLSAEKDKVTELISDISHQTKTPIANILLYAQLLQEQELPQSSLPCVAALNVQAEKLRFLIESLVKTSRLETGVFVLHPVQAEVQPLLDEVLEQIAPQAKEKQLQISSCSTEAMACFDRKWTAEALYNVVDNAVKYTPAGGKVEISVQSYQLFCRIDIRDTGIGISEEEQAKIFARFYRSPQLNQQEGVGIGLYLSRQIIANEGGYMKVTSVIGEGATFSLFLPIEA